MMMNVDRRKAMEKIVGFAGMAAGVAVMSPAVFAANECPIDGAIGVGSDGGADLGANLLTYVELDPFAVAKRAYVAYGRGGCMYGVFDAIVKELAIQGHDDACNFAAIPTNITVYGGGGVKGWGSICGCVNAAAMIVNILDVEQAAVIGAMNRYYEKTPMPRGDDNFLTKIGAPTRRDDAGALLTADKISQSTAHSILCHTSVTNWSAASQFGGHHDAKAERCAQVTAEVAFKTVEFLNLSLNGELTIDPELEMYAKGNDECVTCHTGTTREPEAYIGSDVNAKMECQTCHAPHDEIGKIPHHAEETCSTCHPK
jgi:hypothetical protein